MRTRVRTWHDLVAPAAPTRFSVLVALLLAVGVACVNAVAIVHALNLYHAVAIHVPLDRERAMVHGRQIVLLERRLHVGVEPLVQRHLAHGLWTPLGVLPGALLRRSLVWLYLHALPGWLFAALAWAYLYRPQHFAPAPAGRPAGPGARATHGGMRGPDSSQRPC
jgi:hypothetical protein